MSRQRRSVSQRYDDEDAALDLTPMLDVVFIMLIFFIVTTSFVQESGIEVERPSATTAQRQDSANVLVAISARGDIWVGGRPVHLRALGAAVRTQLDRAPNAAVVIQSDRAAPVARLVEVMDQIRLVGVSNMAIATEGASPR